MFGIAAPVPRVHAQATSASQPATKSALPPRAEKVDAPESNSELEAFRHSPAVQSLAHRFGISTELAAKIFEDLNSAIMIGAILWLVFRFLPNMYRKRSETLDKQIFDATMATSRAKERLAVVEERLSKLDVEIASIREQSERDSVEDERRVHESLETERQRLMASVEQEIESASASARRDLRNYAASLAVERAVSQIHLTEDEDRAMIRAFGQGVHSDGNEERN
jgi:F-type H+-transporting ATPase subunit b